MNDDQVNSVSRYAKRSPRYTLEVHSHCEVPAGCGGFVLRWLDPQAGLPVTLWVYTAGKAEFFLDGRKPASGRPLVQDGEHIIAISAIVSDPSRAFLLFAASAESRPGHPVCQVLSAADGSWKYSLSSPDGGEAWTQLDFKDTEWQPMIEKPSAVPGEARYRYDEIAARGAQPLGIATPASNQNALGRTVRALGLARQDPAFPVWIRKKFVLPAPRLD